MVSKASLNLDILGVTQKGRQPRPSLTLGGWVNQESFDYKGSNLWQAV